VSDLEPREVELRRAARERALELLYEAEAKGSDVDALLASLPLEPSELTVELVRGVDAERPRIDELLARRVAPRWTLARLAAVDRAILRLGAYELIDQLDRSRAVILNEAVVLARRFGTDDSPRFVNGVLSAVARDVRPTGGDQDGWPEGAADAAAEPAEATDADADDGSTEAVEATDEPAEPTGVEDAGLADAGDAEGTSAPQVDGVIFDLDGVIRHWDEEALTDAERAHGLPAGSIARAAFGNEDFEAAMCGRLPADEWAQRIGDAVAAGNPDVDVDPQAVADAFASVGWRIDEEVVDLVRRVRGQVPVALLSNASSRLLDDLRLSGLGDTFDTVVGSADLGVSKPDPKAFTTAAERLGVPADRCLLVDDVADNVSAAGTLGMRTVQFSTLDDLTDQLAALGLLATP
jgi:putative hydrolase of the HAD superfamily